MYYFGSWDTNILFTLNSLAGHSKVIDGLIIFTATYLPFILVATFAWYLYQQREISIIQKGYVFGLAIGTSLIARIVVGSPIRFFFPRPRPFLTYHLCQLIPEVAPGFPSGHALFFFAFSTVVYTYDRRLGSITFLASVIICLARIAAGIHYPSDILAGALLGMIVGLVCVNLAKRSRLFAL